MLLWAFLSAGGLAVGFARDGQAAFVPLFVSAALGTPTMMYVGLRDKIRKLEMATLVDEPILTKRPF